MLVYNLTFKDGNYYYILDDTMLVNKISSDCKTSFSNFSLWLKKFIKQQKILVLKIDEYPNSLIDIQQFVKRNKLKTSKQIPQIWSLKNLKRDFEIDCDLILEKYMKTDYSNINYKFALKSILFKLDNVLYKSIPNIQVYNNISLF